MSMSIPSGPPPARRTTNTLYPSSSAWVRTKRRYVGEIHSGPLGRNELRLYHRFVADVWGGSGENRRRGSQCCDRFKMKAVWSLRRACQKRLPHRRRHDDRGWIAVYSLRMLLVRLHRLPAPPDQGEVPHLQRPLQHRYREKPRVVEVVRLLVLVGQRKRGILRLV
jgi:hypothetical protein